MPAIYEELAAFSATFPALLPTLQAWLLPGSVAAGLTLVSATAFRQPDILRAAIASTNGQDHPQQQAVMDWLRAYTQAVAVVPLTAAVAGLTVEVAPEALQLLLANGEPVGTQQIAGGLLAVYPPRLVGALPSGILQLPRRRDLLWLVHGRLIRRHLAPLVTLLYGLYRVPRATLWAQVRECYAKTLDTLLGLPALRLAAGEDCHLLLATPTSTILGGQNPLYTPA
jgi:hypothetical protein